MPASSTICVSHTVSICTYRELTHTHEHTHMHTHTHAHTHNRLRPPWILSGTTRVSRHQKGKTNLDLLEQDIVSGSGISWAICKSAPWPRCITMPASHQSVFYRSDALPAFLPSNQQRQSTEGITENSVQVTISGQTLLLLQLFYGYLDFVLDNPGEPVSEGTFTHSHLSWSSIIPYLLPPSVMIHDILPVQFMCLTVFLHNLSPSFLWSTS